tara:strand:- start:37 stop:543 length:507 start_codon:yes stop_codon:yes gene_type:complete
MRVIDNFLPEYQFKQFQSVFLGSFFPWYWNEQIVYPSDEGYDPKDYQFTHTLFDRRPPWNGGDSDYYQYVENSSIFSLLGINECYRIKANLTTRTIFTRSSGWHIDFADIPNTAVYYLNTCNGYTKFKKGGKVKSVANRIVIFDSQSYHQGYTCTDQKRRVVMNFNWI